VNPTFRVIGSERCALGESPVWDPDLQQLFWIDAMAPAIWRYDPATGEQTRFPGPDVIGNIVLGPVGSLIVSLRDRVARFDLKSENFETLATFDNLKAGARLNDGKTDRSGRLLTGSMKLGGTSPPQGKLYRLDAQREREVIQTGLAVTNAICFSPAGDRLYFADSLAGEISTCTYHPHSGEVGRREMFFDTEGLGSVPDGATVDAEGVLWVALPFAGRLASVSPEGILVSVLDLPIPHPTCPAFGGTHLNQLYVTSISNSQGAIVSDHPDAGRLLVVEGLESRGLAETRCRIMKHRLAR
jgi:L-arabinonolactonase